MRYDDLLYDINIKDVRGMYKNLAGTRRIYNFFSIISLIVGVNGNFQNY